jgi:hypothetical protein
VDAAYTWLRRKNQNTYLNIWFISIYTMVAQAFQ